MTAISKKWTIIGMLGILLAGFSSTSIAFADTGVDPENIPTIIQPDLLPGPDEGDNQTDVQEYFLQEAIPNFIEGFLGLIAGIAVLAVIIAGIRFVTSYGDEEGITAAKKMAVWATVGFGITLLAYAIVAIINSLAFPQGDYNPDQNTETVEYESIGN